MLNTKKYIKKSAYLEDKQKIKNLIQDVGYLHLLEYLIEDLDSHEIVNNEDLWILRMAESLEDAYNVYTSKYKDEDNIDSRITPNEN
jgi:hypothetical protein